MDKPGPGREAQNSLYKQQAQQPWQQMQQAQAQQRQQMQPWQPQQQLSLRRTQPPAAGNVLADLWAV
jgi:hypothetical protein